MKTVTIRWQRLTDVNGQTCARCMSTQNSIQSAYRKLKESFSVLDIEVILQKENIDFPIFSKDPLQSNRIWVNEKPLEQWIGATVGQSKCCDVCGESECRTVTIGQDTFEIIPEDMIIQAAFLAAADILKKNPIINKS